MTAELIERCRIWLDRLWAGEVLLISDASWLPDPMDCDGDR